MRFLHKWQGKISKIVIDEGSPSNTPNDNHQFKIVSLQKQSSLLKHLMYFFWITQEVARKSHNSSTERYSPFSPSLIGNMTSEARIEEITL